MEIVENKLVINTEVNDEMLEELKNNLSKVDEIEINTEDITSLALQQIICVQKDKKVIINNQFIAQFFEDVKYQ